MPAEAEPSPVSDIAALTTKLDSLRAGQDAEALSKALRSAITERELYKMYLSSLAEDEARAKVLLEVFDKVCTNNKCHSGVILTTTVRHRLLQSHKAT